MMEANNQYRRKENVWALIVNNQIIGTYFSSQTLNGEGYLEFLDDDFVIPNPKSLFLDNDIPTIK